MTASRRSVALVAPATAVHAAYDATHGYDPIADKGALHTIARNVGAHGAFLAGYTGKGIGIALVDTGVTEVPGLDSGNVWHGPDLSFDSQDPELTHRDGYGHGTHLASIMVGRDAPGRPKSYTDPATFTGIAPDAITAGTWSGRTWREEFWAGRTWRIADPASAGWR